MSRSPQVLSCKLGVLAVVGTTDIKECRLIVLGTAVAIAATMISLWYIKSKSSLDHMLD